MYLQEIETSGSGSDTLLLLDGLLVLLLNISKISPCI